MSWRTPETAIISLYSVNQLVFITEALVSLWDTNCIFHSKRELISVFNDLSLFEPLLTHASVLHECYFECLLLFTHTFLFSYSYFNMHRAYRKLFFLNFVSSLICILLFSLLLCSCVKKATASSNCSFPCVCIAIAFFPPRWYLSTGTSNSTSINLVNYIKFLTYLMFVLIWAAYLHPPFMFLLPP